MIWYYGINWWLLRLGNTVDKEDIVMVFFPLAAGVGERLGTSVQKKIISGTPFNAYYSC